jgi:hypothetical protein
VARLESPSQRDLDAVSGCYLLSWPRRAAVLYARRAMGLDRRGVAVQQAHPLGEVLLHAVSGRWPAADGRVEVLPALPNGRAAVIGFTGHFVVAADVDPTWVASRLAPGDLLAPLGSEFLQALAGALAKEPDGLDLVCCARAEVGPTPIEVQLVADRSHPRVRRAQRYRDDLRVYQTPDADGMLVLGRGVCGRWEAAFEVEPRARNRGLGRALALCARRLLEPGEPVFMQCAPGNVASLRAILHAGFAPICGEVLYE